jgi:hypothetical protein
MFTEHQSVSTVQQEQAVLLVALVAVAVSRLRVAHHQILLAVQAVQVTM